MAFLGFPPYFIFTSFLTTLLLDRGVHVSGNKQFPTSSPWYPSATPPRIAKPSNNESEALKKILPLVTFDCRRKTGYFPDSKFNCEVFHYCQPDGARNTFHCPAHQLFNQLSMVCEEKTVHNSKLCREGSISPSNFKDFSNSKKHDSKQKAMQFIKPLLTSNSSTETTKKIVTLEELLSYMNSEQNGKETEPTFISRFHKAEEPSKSKTVPNSAITTSKPETKPNKVKKPFKSMDENLNAEGSDQTYSVIKTSPKSKKSEAKSKKNVEEEEEEVSAEYDAIEGRKGKKNKRVGRVLDVEAESKEKEKKPHSHMAERSASEAPQEENTTPPAISDTESKNSNSPSLFSTDRNKVRKRKRYQGRKRKTTTTPATSIETDMESGSTATTTVPTLQTARQDFDTIRSNANRRRKSQRTRNRDDAHKNHKSEKFVEPYTLPPLPTPADEKAETTTESMQKEERRRTKNPWYKTTLPPTDERVKFGEKLSDQHHHQTDAKVTESPAFSEDFYAIKDIHTSEELLGEEYRESFQTNSKSPSDMRSNHRSKVKTFNTHHNDQDDDGYRYGLPPEHHPTIHPENLFPPPRAEAREHHSTPPQQMLIGHESGDEKSKMYGYSKVTTEDPFSVTYPYMEKYQTGVQELKELEEQRWKSNPEKTKSEKKIAVGSTFFFQNSAIPETTKKPRLQVPPTTESPPVTTTVNKVKDISKHTLAHQHLSKIMNDFFAMSSSNQPGRVHLDSIKNEEDIIMPEYRIPDEDIYGSESVSEDVEEIPPELLEVVDLITGNSRSEKRDSKPHSSHEVIKINGPITDSHLEKIFLDDKFDEYSDQQRSEDGSYKKFVVIPQPEMKEENRDIEDDEEITTLKLEPLLQQFSEEKSLTVIPLKSEPVQKRQPTVLRAKKIPVRVIYRDQLEETIRPKQSTRKPNIKIVQAHLPPPRMKVISHEKRQSSRPITHSYAAHSQPPIVIHPPSLYPPHPPPLIRKPPHFRIGYPFAINSMSPLRNPRPIHSRRKRSIMSRLRRQIRQNQHFLPFSGPVYPSFNPKFVPTFSPFKALFSPTSLNSASSHLAPFTFPGYPLEKPSQNRPHIYRPNHSRPPPVRHVTQAGHQTVIVEEVPVPIPVEVPSPNLMHPAPSGIPQKLPPRYPGNQFRAPSPPAIQTPPLIQRPPNRYPPPPNSYRPFGMPSNARPPALDYRSPIPLTGPLPPRITSQGQIYALGVTNKPILPPSNPRPARPPNGNPNHSPRTPPRPHNPFNIHANEYPNFPYFQGAFTTPISNEPLPGRIMYSGYRPPKSTPSTKPPKRPSQSSKDRKPAESNSNRSRSKTRDYLEPPRPMRESHVSYTEEVLSRGRPRPKPNLDDYSSNHSDLKSPRQNLNKNSQSSEETVPRKRRPARRRRPRPHSTTTQGTPILNDISPTPPPPEQIPPPPADYTSKPSQHEIPSPLPSLSEGTKAHETSSHFPPAGYYGRDQLVQFFETSSKPTQKVTSPKPYHLKNLGESRASSELDESLSSISMEDSDQPAFGTRLRSKPQSQSRSRQQKSKQPPRSQTQKNEVRTRPSNRPEETGEWKENMQAKPNEGDKTQIRQERPPPRRRRPPPPRPRNRPPPMNRPSPEVHHFNYDSMGSFYSVPPGLQNIVAPAKKPQQGFRGSTDMFGIPHPVIDQSIYSLRPQGAPVDFDTNFFSVPAHVAQQQQSPLHKMNIKPVPESAREFFTAPETGSTTAAEDSAPEKKEPENRSIPNKPGGENKERDPPVRKLRKPKRKHRYNPHSTEQKDSTEVNSAKPYTDQTTPRDSSTTRYREKSTTFATTTAEPRSTVTASASTNDIKSTHYHSQNDIKESPVVFKQRAPLLPKTLPEFSKSLLNGKIDIQKLNATISTSVSVSGAFPQKNDSSSEEKENKRVFSSQNGGGLAVVRKGPKRKRARQRVSTTTGVPYVNNESSTDAKYEIAASVLDIIKATTETERQASGYYDNYNYNKNERPSSSRGSSTWVESFSNKRQQS